MKQANGRHMLASYSILFLPHVFSLRLYLFFSPFRYDTQLSCYTVFPSNGINRAGVGAAGPAESASRGGESSSMEVVEHKHGVLAAFLNSLSPANLLRGWKARSKSHQDCSMPKVERSE